MAKKRRRVPKALRGAFGDRVRTLAETILSLLPKPPPPPMECLCRGRGCLGCAGSSFLLHPEDGRDYRQLLNHCFCVVSSDAPELIDLCYRREWTQRLIVRNVMELLMDRSRPSNNVLCEGYDKRSRFNLNGELLCSSAWNLLLTRIGESAMSFLLKFSSIFIPLPTNNHYQVSGLPLNKFLQDPNFSHKSVIGLLASKDKQALPIGDHVNFGYKLKRKRIKFEEKQESFAHASLMEPHKFSLILEDFSLKNSRASMKDKNNSTPSVHLGQANSPCLIDNDENFTPLNGTFYSNSTFCPKSRKHRRLFSWQRHRKRKKADTLDENLNSHNGKESSGGMLQPRSAISLYNKPAEQVRKVACSGINQSCEAVSRHPTNIAALQENIRHGEAINYEQSGKFHTNMTSLCFNCSMLQSPPKGTRRVEIRKKHMFYNSGSSPSIFPRDHILNQLKPNNSGAHDLMKHIFAKSDGSSNTELVSCFHANGGPAVRSGCLYHSLLGILKALIRNAQRCRYLEFLRRHCSVSNFRGCSSDNKGLTSEAVKRKLILLNKLEKKRAGLQESSENLFSSGNRDGNKQTEELHENYSMECDLQFDQSGSYCQHEEVVSFLWAASRSIIPIDLLGDSSNWRTLRRHISKFVRLRRFEMFYLRQCLRGLKTSKFSFLARIPNHVCYCFNKDDSSVVKDLKKSNNDWIALKDKLFQRWIYWFFSYIIVPLLGANFYITERESERQEVFYYSKPVWRRLVARTINCLKEQNYRPVDHKFFEQIVSSRPFGFSKVRFLPKEKGVRLLANLKAPSKAWLHMKSSSGHCTAQTGNEARADLKPGKSNRKAKLIHFRSVNSTLRDMYAILNRIKIECPQMLGASVFDYNDIYQMLHQFLSRLRNGSTTIPKVFIVVSDVSKAFDSIDQDRLLDVMKAVIQKEEYHIRKYAQVICTKKTMRTLYGHVCLGQSKDNDFVNYLASIRFRSSHGVLIDQGVDRKIKQVEIQHLREHVKSNILQLGQGFYLQKSGIAQGSLLSSLLCSFYFGHLERTIIFPFLGKICDLSNASFNNCKEWNSTGCTQVYKQDVVFEEPLKKIDLEKDEKGSAWKSNKWQGVDSERDNGMADSSFPFPRYLLLRLIDDFLFISTSRRQAISFFNRLCRGFREYNCFMNGEKFGLNFVAENQSQPIPDRRYVGADGVSFLPWSGLLVNCDTLEIQADYTRYLGTHLRSTLTVQEHTKLGEHLEEKLCNYMRPKCHPIFYDSSINSPAVVRLNAYQAFLLCAMKFHCYLREIPNTFDLGPIYYLKIIQKSFRYMHSLIKKRMYSTERRQFSFQPVLKLKKAETIWLGLSAYIRVFRKKQSRHAKLLSLLVAKLGSLGSVDCELCHLKYAVDDSHSSLFWKIKY